MATFIRTNSKFSEGEVTCVSQGMCVSGEATEGSAILITLLIQNEYDYAKK